MYVKRTRTLGKEYFYCNFLIFVQGDNIPPGYSPVSLIEALNGPPQVTVRNQPTSDSNDGADADATNVS